MEMEPHGGVAKPGQAYLRIPPRCVEEIGSSLLKASSLIWAWKTRDHVQIAKETLTLALMWRRLRKVSLAWKISCPWGKSCSFAAISVLATISIWVVCQVFQEEFRSPKAANTTLGLSGQAGEMFSLSWSRSPNRRLRDIERSSYRQASTHQLVPVLTHTLASGSLAHGYHH